MQALNHIKKMVQNQSDGFPEKNHLTGIEKIYLFITNLGRFFNYFLFHPHAHSPDAPPGRAG